MGAVVDWVERFIPSSYTAMAAATPYWPSDGFQAHADYVKYRLFASSVDVGAESSVYDPVLLEFIGKITTVRVIPAAVDFWGNQKLTIDIATGTHNEKHTYPERREDLWKVYDRLMGEIRKDYGPFRGIYGFVAWGSVEGVTPKVSFGNGDKITPDPHDFNKLFDAYEPFQTSMVGGSI